jgi:hypothetical protein
MKAIGTLLSAQVMVYFRGAMVGFTYSCKI